MSTVGTLERARQNRVLTLFRDELGYHSLGDWTDRAVYLLRTEADNSRFKLDKYLLKMCAKARLIELMHDFVFDFGVKPRLSSQRGNAILVASSIYEACKYFELFQKTAFKGECAVVTSYNPPREGCDAGSVLSANLHELTPRPR